MNRIAALLVTLMFCAGIAAQGYPSRPVTLVVPLAAGSTADIVSRIVGAELAKRLAQPVVVENRPGAGGIIALQQVASAPPDGYTIALVTNGTLAINMGLYAKPGYDPVKDFTPITLVGEVSNIMVVHPNNPAKTVGDVIARAKAKPGETTFSSGGNGTSHHLSGVLFAKMAGLDIVHVPYKGAPQGVFAVMANEVSMGFFNTPSVISQIRDGKLKALAVTSKTRIPLFPALPTLDESGLKGYEVTAWFGFAGPRGLPAPIRDRLYNEIVSLMKDPAVRDQLVNQGFQLLPQMAPIEFGDLIQSEVAKWVPIVKASGAKIE